jgi:predicted acylesterase/phospholipase RssA
VDKLARAPSNNDSASDSSDNPLALPAKNFGIVLSGGGSRAAYQAGALKAITKYVEANGPVGTITGSSIGAVNGIVLGGCLSKGYASAVENINELWKERNFRNTFRGSPSMAFIRALQVAVLQYSNPGPSASQISIFDPTPLMNRIQHFINESGGLNPKDRTPSLKSIAVMTTVEGEERKPLLFVSAKEKINEQLLVGANFEIVYADNLGVAHAFASAALPSVLPPIELDLETRNIRLVDGGISDNIPIDPAVRLGATDIVLIDISGKKWWLDRYGKPHYTREAWEVPAKVGTFCPLPSRVLEIRNTTPLGAALKEAVGHSTREFIAALGPTWPIFRILKSRMGEELAYEVVSYVALHPDYIAGLIERGYNDAMKALEASLGSTP